MFSLAYFGKCLPRTHMKQENRMGMFDYVRCEAELPETAVPPPATEDGGRFQTKDTPDQYMTTYTITKDGYLTWRPYHMEEVPKAERPYPDAPDDDIMSYCGCVRRVEDAPERIDYHGDIRFYTGGGRGKGWWEYSARFTEGKLARIDLLDFTPPETGEQDGMEANRIRTQRQP